MSKVTNNKLTLYFTKVYNIEQAQIMRGIRNKCRKFMTRNNNYITKQNQKKWFKESNDIYDGYIVGTLEEGVIYIEVGYGLIKKNEKEFFLTGALVPEYRGKGHGTDIFEFLIKKCIEIKPDNDIKLEVLNDNVIARNLYNKIGFIEINSNDKLTTMILKKEKND